MAYPGGPGGAVSRLAEIYLAALDVRPDDRAAFVRDAAAGDPTLEAEVLALLAVDDTAPGPLDVPLPLLAAPLLAGGEAGAGGGAAASGAGAGPASSSGLEGQRIGPFRVVEELGRGGMGTVYMAERADGAYEQQVALKVMNAGLITPELERRFLRERQILARLEHPRIARLLHGGLTPRGDPYLAMERVDGDPITRWAEARGLDVEARLRLFLDACDAVRYAHGRLVVHRDLKPSNIVVTPTGEVRLLDFGIARLLSPDGEGDDEAATRAGLLLLTPEYAAPELIRGDPASIATDVYALGVVLHELLTGHRPFDADAVSLADLARRAEREPPIPSRDPGLDPGRRRRLRGDLDAIVHRALRAEPERRYPTVDALEDDVRRHLDRRPVAARPDTRRYRAGRFVRRHTVGVGATAAVAIALMVGFAGTAWMAAAARREEARTEAIRAFLFDLWEDADPATSQGRVPTARDLLDRGADRIDALAASAGPEVRVDMLSTLGTLYNRLGEYARATEIFDRAVWEARAAFGDTEPTAAALDGLAQSLAEVGDLDGAEAAARESVAIRRAGRADPVALASAYSALGVILGRTSRYDDALDAHRTALDLDRRGAGARSAPVATDLNNLGVVALRLGRHDEAEAYHREALAIRREVLGEWHPETATSLGQLAAVMLDLGSSAEAEALQRRALEVRRDLLGEDHPDVAISLDQLSLILASAGRHAEADSVATEALAIRRRVLGEGHPETLTSMNNLATVRFRRGEYAWAADMQEQVVEAWRQELGLDDSRTLTALTNLGVMRLRAGDLAAADRHLSEALDGRRRILEPDHPVIGASLRWLSELRLAQGRETESESIGRRALAIFQAAYPPGHPRIAEAGIVVAAALVEAGRPAEAVPLLRGALDARREAFPDDGLEVAEARVWLGIALADTGETAEAAPLLRAALDAYRAAGRIDEPVGARAAGALARLGRVD